MAEYETLQDLQKYIGKGLLRAGTTLTDPDPHLTPSQTLNLLCQILDKVTEDICENKNLFQPRETKKPLTPLERARKRRLQREHFVKHFRS